MIRERIQEPIGMARPSDMTRLSKAMSCYLSD